MDQRTKFVDTQDLVGHTAAACRLIEMIWPKYASLFEQETIAYQKTPELFKPYFALAFNKEDLIGLALMTSSMMSLDQKAITWVCVSPDYQGQGVGKALVICCLAEAKKHNKSVVLTTSKPEFYLRLGFEGPHHYRAGDGHAILTITP